MFDILTYEKGASVLRMFERWAGADAFRDGVRTLPASARLRQHRHARSVGRSGGGDVGRRRSDDEHLDPPGGPSADLRRRHRDRRHDRAAAFRVRRRRPPRRRVVDRAAPFERRGRRGAVRHDRAPRLGRYQRRPRGDARVDRGQLRLHRLLPNALRAGHAGGTPRGGRRSVAARPLRARRRRVGALSRRPHHARRGRRHVASGRGRRARGVGVATDRRRRRESGRSQRGGRSARHRAARRRAHRGAPRARRCRRPQFHDRRRPRSPLGPVPPRRYRRRDRLDHRRGADPVRRTPGIDQRRPRDERRGARRRRGARHRVRLRDGGGNVPRRQHAAGGAASVGRTRAVPRRVQHGPHLRDVRHRGAHAERAVHPRPVDGQPHERSARAGNSCATGGTSWSIGSPRPRSSAWHRAFGRSPRAPSPPTCSSSSIRTPSPRRPSLSSRSSNGCGSTPRPAVASAATAQRESPRNCDERVAVGSPGGVRHGGHLGADHLAVPAIGCRHVRRCRAGSSRGERGRPRCRRPGRTHTRLVVRGPRHVRRRQGR